MSIAPEVLETISKLSFNDLLSYISTGLLLKKYGKEAVDYARAKVREYWLTKQYGFTPSEEQANLLQQIGKRDIYKRLKYCVGNHWSLSLIRVGIYISELNKEGRKEMIYAIKGGIYDTYGKKGTDLLALGNTGMIVPVIEHISDLKLTKNYNQLDLSVELDRIIETWESIIILAKGEHSVEEIKGECIRYMNRKLPQFFIFASESVVLKVEQAIYDLCVAGIILKKEYQFRTRYKDNPSRVVEKTWIFEHNLPSVV